MSSSDRLLLFNIISRCNGSLGWYTILDGPVISISLQYRARDPSCIQHGGRSASYFKLCLITNWFT